MPPEPITAAPPYEISRPLSTQALRDVVFLHWRVEPHAVRHLFPPGTRPDVFDGTTCVGVVALRMAEVRVAGLPVGDFLELNLRLYSVDEQGRRAVVFRVMEASQPAFALGGRIAVRLPYTWAAIRYARQVDEISYATRRADRGHAGLRLAVRIGAPIQGTSRDHFRTARWGLHVRWYGGRTLYIPITHEPWPLHEAHLLTFVDTGLFTAAGLPAPSTPPVSVMYAPAVRCRIGGPRGPRRRPSG